MTRAELKHYANYWCQNSECRSAEPSRLESEFMRHLQTLRPDAANANKCYDHVDEYNQVTRGGHRGTVRVSLPNTRVLLHPGVGSSCGYYYLQRY